MDNKKSKSRDEDKIYSCERLLSDYGYSIKPPQKYTERMACMSYHLSQNLDPTQRKRLFSQLSGPLEYGGCDVRDEHSSTYRYRLLRKFEEELKEYPDNLEIRKNIFRLKHSLLKDGHNPNFDTS
jgi:hypothetical protein